MKIVKPDLPDRLIPDGEFEKNIKECVKNESAYEKRTVVRAALCGEDLSHIEFSKAVLESCSFASCSFYKTSFEDVILRDCDLSNCDFTSGYFNRCEFYNCKGVGMHVCDAVVYNTSFSCCNLSLSNFGTTRCDRISFDECRMNEATLSGMKLKGASFSNNNMSGINFFETSLSGVDLTQNNIEGMCVSQSLTELRGAILSGEQACIIARMLGICVE